MDRSTTEQERHAGLDAPVVVYTASWCRACDNVKKYLTRKGVKFEEVDVESVQESPDQVTLWTTGFRTVPTIKIGETIVAGWDKQALDEALSSRGATSVRPATPQPES